MTIRLSGFCRTPRTLPSCSSPACAWPLARWH